MNKIDKVKILKLINKCVHLKFLFCGVFPAESFPKLFADSFIVVNASEAGTIGTHWLLVCKKTTKFILLMHWEIRCKSVLQFTNGYTVSMEKLFKLNCVH